MKCEGLSLGKNCLLSVVDVLLLLLLLFLTLCMLNKNNNWMEGVVGWCEGAVYLTSLGRPTDIGLQLGKACYPCSG